MSETDAASAAKGPSGSSWLGSNKTRLLLVGLVLALSLGYLLYTAFPGSVRYYLTVSEFVADEANMAGREVRVVGRLEPGSHLTEQGTLDHTFILADGDQRLDANYSGVVPDLFENEHSEIVMEGTYQGGSFQAHTLIVKCPSKYQALAQERGL